MIAALTNPTHIAKDASTIDEHMKRCIVGGLGLRITLHIIYAGKLSMLIEYNFLQGLEAEGHAGMIRLTTVGTKRVQDREFSQLRADVCM